MTAGDSHITKHHHKTSSDAVHHHGGTHHSVFNASELQSHHSYTHPHHPEHDHTKTAVNKHSDSLVMTPAHQAFAKPAVAKAEEHDEKHKKTIASTDHSKHENTTKTVTAEKKHDKPAQVAKATEQRKGLAQADATSADVKKTAPAVADHKTADRKVADHKTEDHKTTDHKVASTDDSKHKRQGLTQADATSADATTVAKVPGSVEAPKAAASKEHLDVPPFNYEAVGTSRKEKPAEVATSDTRATTAAPSEKTIVSPGNEKLEAGHKPAIEIQTSDTSKADKPYTFRVTGHGRVLDSQGQEVSKNISFDHGVPKDIVIKVDKPDNFDKMSKAEQTAAKADQQAHLNDFVRQTLNPAIRAASPEASAQGIELRDSTRSLQPDAAREIMQSDAQRQATEAPLKPAEKPVVAPQTNYSDSERHAYHRMNGRHGMRNGHTGSMPREYADTFFPKGTQQMPGESADMAARRETLAASFAPDKADPYGTVRQQPDHHSYAVGRYGHSFNHFNHLMHSALDGAMHHWPQSVLAEMTDADGNIDWSKLSQVLKEHPDLMQGVQDSVKAAGLPDALADKFSDADKLGNFGNFVTKLRGDAGPISKQELAANFGKDAQDAMAQQTVERGTRTGKTAAETALAQHLGIEPDQLTDAQKNDPSNKPFLDAANKLYALANARENNGQYGDKRAYDKFDWAVSNDGNARAEADLNPESANKMARWAIDWARTNETRDPVTGTGNCTRLWRRAIERVTGHDIGSMSGVQQTHYIEELARKGYFRQVSESEAQPGDFGGRAWRQSVAAAYGRNLGDSFMVTGRNGNAVLGSNGASHNQFVANNNSSRYTPNVYFRPTEKFLNLFRDGSENT